MGVVYHANYLVWCEIGRTDLLRQLGATYAEMERQGAFLAVSDARVSFRAAAHYDDLIRVRTTLERLRSRSVTFSYVVENAETSAVLAKAQTDLICLNRDRTPRKLPGEIRKLLGRVTGDFSQEGTISALSGV
jgi:acyl-CoA thioester hydrolase